MLVQGFTGIQLFFQSKIVWLGQANMFPLGSLYFVAVC
jgi:hypothetical protein